VSSGRINATRWRGYDPEAVAVARASGDEDAYAQTLEPYDWRTREETAAVLALARQWHRPAAVFRALSVVARDALIYHGAHREAFERGQELLAAAVRYGSIAGQPEALAQVASARIVLGEGLLAQQTAGRAAELIARLGAGHRLHAILEGPMAAVLAYYLDGDWPAIAARAVQLAAEPAVGRRGIFGLLMAATSVLAHSQAGDAPAAREMLAGLTCESIMRSPRRPQATEPFSIGGSGARGWDGTLVDRPAPPSELAAVVRRGIADRARISAGVALGGARMRDL
jgi:hypothetical protein